MERKWLIAIVIIAIIVVGGLGWYFLFMPKEEAEGPPKVYIDAQDYTIPLVWNITAVKGASNMSIAHTLTNSETSPMNVTFSYTIWHFNTTLNQWVQEWNGTHWTRRWNGTRWVEIKHNATTTLLSGANQTKISSIAWAEQKAGDQSTYYYSLKATDQMIYIDFQYPKEGNPTIDGQTVFTYLCLDGNGDKLLNENDKAFNLTNNPNRANVNELKVYQPQNTTSWNPTATEYSWNETTSPSTVPITVIISSDRRNITYAIPYNYIGAKINTKIGWAFQAFSKDWMPYGANQDTPDKYQQVQLSLPQKLNFVLEPQKTIRFYIKVTFDSTAVGDYSFIYTAMVPSS